MGKRSKSMKNRLLVAILSLAMLLTGVTVPTGTEKAQAAEKIEGVSITIRKVSGDAPWAWMEYTLDITNNSQSDISNFVIKIPITSAVTSLTTWDGQWTNKFTNSSYTGDAIILHFQGTISGNGGGIKGTDDDKFGFGGSEEPRFGTPEAYVDDGSFGSGGGGGSTIDPDLELEYNFAKALQYSLYFYDANMCGPDVGEETAFTWRDDCHTEDQTMTYNGKTVDVSGGYHDAGDHVKFNLPQAYAASTLGIGYYEFKEAFTEQRQDEHMRIIMDRFVEYFENCTVLDSSGKVETYCYQVGDGGKDHGYWGPPEEQYNRQGEAYFTSADTPCTDIVGETAAALAIYAFNYKDEDKEASDEALKYAKALFEYAESNPKITSNSGDSKAKGFYNGDKWQDDMALASIWLYKATGDSSYQTKYNEYVQGCSPYWIMCWNDVSAAAYLYGGQYDNTRQTIDSHLLKEKTPQGYVYVDGEGWGTARYNTTLQLMGLAVDKESGKEDYQTWALGQMSYLMGNNDSGRNYIVGYNANSYKAAHHRAASGHIGNVNDSLPMAHTLYGALLGGPFSDDSYIDKASNYYCAEVALDYNAGFVGALAGLYLQQRDGEFKDDQYLAAPGEMDEVKTSYGSDPNATPRPAKTPKPSSTPNPDETSDPDSSNAPNITSNPDSSSNPGGGDSGSGSGGSGDSGDLGSGSGGSGGSGDSGSGSGGSGGSGDSGSGSGGSGGSGDSGSGSGGSGGSGDSGSGSGGSGGSGNQGGDSSQTPGSTSDPNASQSPQASNLPDVGTVEGVITDTSTAIDNKWSGADAELAEQSILSQNGDKDIAGSTFGALKLRATKTTKNSVKLKWASVKGASKYIVYGNRCGSAMEKLATVTGTSWTHSGLKKGTYYKYVVTACQTVSGVDVSLSISKTVHATTLGGKKGNAKKVTVKKAKVKLKKGKSFKIKAKQIPLKKKNKIANHRKISYESSKPKIATVSSSGKIKAKKKGKCTIYVYAQNGIYKQVKVTVK